MKHKQDLTEYFGRIGVFHSESFVLIDVGCSGGISNYWRAFGKDLVAFGFDPQKSEVARLNQEEINPNIRYFSKFVGLSSDHPFVKDKAEVLSRESYSDSHFKLWNRLSAAYGVQLRPEQPHLRLQSQAINEDLVDFSELIAVDAFVKKQALGYVDFIKIDVDGLDFEVLVSTESILKSHQVLGIQVEVNFDSSASQMDNAFHNMDRRMRELGYSLIDLDFRRYSRAALPSPFIYDILAQTEEGQPIQGDAVYAVDAASPLYSKVWGEELSPVKLLKLSAIYDLYGLSDLAAELLSVYREKLSSVVDIDVCLNIITPLLDGKKMSYADYVEAFRKDVASFFPKSVKKNGNELSEQMTPEIESLRKEEIESLKKEVDELRQKVEVYRNSRSWWITKPLRSFSKIIRSFK